MKKLILFITVIAFALTVSAQSGGTKAIGRNASNVTFTGTAADSISTNQLWTRSYNLSAKDKRQGYDLLFTLDSVSGTPTLTMVLNTSQDGGTTLVPIDTALWYGTTSDTSFVFKDVATGILSKEVVLTTTSSAGVGKVGEIVGKIGDL